MIFHLYLLTNHQSYETIYQTLRGIERDDKDREDVCIKMNMHKALWLQLSTDIGHTFLTNFPAKHQPIKLQGIKLRNKWNKSTHEKLLDLYLIFYNIL